MISPEPADPTAPGSAGTTAVHRGLPARMILALAAAAALVIVIVLVVYLQHRSAGRNRAYENAMVMGLDTLVTAEEGFFYDSARYTPSLGAFPQLPLAPGVRLTIDSASARGWWGTATHDKLPARRCQVWVGTPPARFPPAARAPETEGRPTCFDVGGRAR